MLRPRRMLLTMTQTLTPITIHGANDFDARVSESEGRPLRGASIDTVQVNIGLRCNLACHHCHVESGPNRTEEMSWETMSAVLDAARKAGARRSTSPAVRRRCTRTSAGSSRPPGGKGSASSCGRT